MAIDPRIRVLYYLFLPPAAQHTIALLRDGEAYKAFKREAGHIDLANGDFETARRLVADALVEDLLNEARS